MANIASLIVSIGSDISKLEKGLSQAQRAIANTGKQMTQMGKTMSKNVTAPITALAAGVVALQKRTGEYADRIQDLSDVTGISTDALQEWDFVARRVGVSTDVISSAFSSLGRRMSQFSRGSGPAVDAAEKLGVAFRDSNGQMRNADDLIMDLLGGLSQMPPDLERAELGTALFGRRWEMLAPVIGRGSDGIEQIRKEAQELGIVMSGESLEAANEFREAFVTFQERISSVGRSLAIDLMPVVLDLVPVFERVVEVVTTTLQRFTQMDKATQMNVIQIGALAAAIGPALLMLGKMATGIASVTTAVRALTVAMATNPFLLIATGVAAVISSMAIANAKTQAFRRNLQEVLDMKPEGTENELAIIAENIAGLEREIESVQRTRRFANIEQRAQADEEIERIRGQITALEDLRAETALLQLERKNDVSNTNEQAEAINNLNTALDRSLFLFRDLAGQRAADAGMPEDDIIEDLSLDLERHVNQPISGSIAHIDQEIRRMTDFYMNATTEASREFARTMIEGLQGQRDEMHGLGGDVDNLTRSFEGFGMLASQVLDRLIFSGERLSNVLRSVGRQLFSRGLITALTGGFSGGIGAGLLNIIGVNDALITSGGDVVKFHPDDNILAMKDFSALGGGNMKSQHVTVTGVLQGQDIFVTNARGGDSYNR